MDAIQHEALQRHFLARRLHPWIPEHAIFIKGELAKLDVLDKHDAESFRAFYEEKMEKYREEHPEEFKKEEEEKKKEEVKIEEPKIEEELKVEEKKAPKKKGRKPKVK